MGCERQAQTCACSAGNAFYPYPERQGFAVLLLPAWGSIIGPSIPSRRHGYYGSCQPVLEVSRCDMQLIDVGLEPLRALTNRCRLALRAMTITNAGRAALPGVPHR